MTSDNQKDFWVAPKTVDVLLRHATRLKRSKDGNLLAHLDTIPDSESRAKLGPGRPNRGKLAKLAELQQALDELSSLTKRAMKQLEEEAAERHVPPRKAEPAAASPFVPALSPQTQTQAPEDRNQRFREVASRFTSAANRKRFLEVMPHISAPLPGDDDDEVIRFRGPTRAPPVPQKSLPAVPMSSAYPYGRRQ